MPRSAVAHGVHNELLLTNEVRVALARIGLVALLLALPASSLASESREIETPSCPPDMTRASGEPDDAIFSDAASRGVRGHWCERYDDWGEATRSGPYWETHASGSIRVLGRYIDSRLEGPIIVFHTSGEVFARGFLEAGEWSGAFEILHENGAPWFQANMRRGQLDGSVATFYADGELESEARYQAGREDGLARSFFAAGAGGRLRSEAHIEADQFIGVHRVLDREGHLIRSIDWDRAPLDWSGPSKGQGTPIDPGSRSGSPAAPKPNGPARATGGLR